MTKSPKKQKIVIALSGGGDRTYYYAGILFGLQQKYDIVEVSTVSGASYTIPLTINSKTFSQAISMATKFNPLDFLTEVPADQVIKQRGIYTFNDRFYKYLNSLIPANTGANHIPKLAPIASYISNGYADSVNLQRAPLPIAIAASISLPFLFTPIKFKGRLLFDGALAGTVNTDVFNKYPKIPSIMLTSVKNQTAIISTVQNGVNYLKASPRKLYQLKQLIDNEPILRKITKKLANTTATQSNFKINCDSVSDYGFMLSNETKIKLFSLGYKKSFEIYPQLEYYISTGRYKQLVNHEIDD